MSRHLAFVILALLATAGAARAAARTAQARRRTATVQVDGRLEEADWAAAPRSNGFTQRTPKDGAPSSFPTEFRVLYDDEAVYVGVRAEDGDPAAIRALLTRRDEDSLSDWVGVAIDSYYDRRTAFAFMINAASVQRDFLMYDDNKTDPSWNAVWQGSAAVDGRGWTAELRIPLSQLRFPRAERQTWGLQVVRYVARSKEESYWVPLPQDSVRNVGLFGDLTGVERVRPSRRFEVLPYAVAGARGSESAWRDPDPIGDVGVDLKYGLTSNLTLDATLNPDFGQVEADPSQVNLSAYETFFAEKRPFFIEGIDIFRFHLGQGDGSNATETLFYSRRIGAPPYGSPSGRDLLSGADTTTIYGAAKLSGKLPGGLSIGALSALTAEEDGAVDDGMGMRVGEVIEPLTSYNLVSLRQDMLGGRTNVGAAMSAVARDLDGTGFEPVLHDQAYTGGLQFTQLLGETNDYALELKAFGSYVHGTPEALDATQRSSAHYFQRPDASHLDYDPTRTDLAGWGAQYVASKSGGGHVRGALGGDFRSPGLELNDLGYQRRADTGFQWGWFQLRDDRQGRYFQHRILNFNVWEGFDFEPSHHTVGGNVNGFVELTNFWSTNGGYGVDFNHRDPTLLRGGPAVRTDIGHNLWWNLNSDSRRRVYAGLGAGYWSQPASDSWVVDTWAEITVQARSNLRLTVGPSGQTREIDNQYVAEVADAMGTPHYALARLDQDTLALTLRLNYTLSPAVSLQVYAQPFVSVGRYSGFKEVASPMADRYNERYRLYPAGAVTEMDGVLEIDRDGDGTADLQLDKPDFSFRQVRSNVVLRWEYLPGSTLFAVWSHGRTSDVASRRLRPGQDLGELMDADGEHVFLLKLSYWIGT